MKKFLFIFIFILVAGYVFFAGWTQIRMKPDTFGIVKSKLGGMHSKPVLPGQFSWNWDFIIPKNAHMELFSTIPYSAEKKVSGQMPANELYTMLYNDNMNYSFEFSISLAIEPDEIVKLIQKNIIASDADLRNYLDQVADYVCQLTASYYLTRAQSDPNFKPESVKRSDIIRALSLYEEYPEVDIAVLALRDYKIPNYSLYAKFQNTLLNNPSLLNSLSNKNQSDLSALIQDTQNQMTPISNQSSNQTAEESKVESESQAAESEVQVF
ncbi:MAG: hypothetical protein K5829_01530 [Treponema sp.]|nr:hypothetical protein [Treponema sp.]